MIASQPPMHVNPNNLVKIRRAQILMFVVTIFHLLIHECARLLTTVLCQCCIPYQLDKLCPELISMVDSLSLEIGSVLPQRGLLSQDAHTCKNLLICMFGSLDVQ